MYTFYSTSQPLKRNRVKHLEKTGRELPVSQGITVVEIFTSREPI